MSTQRYHFLTIVGRTGLDVHHACDALLKRRMPDGFGGFEYSPATDARISRLCRTIIAAADALPVLHYATTVDGYAMGNLGLEEFPRSDGKPHAVLGLNYGIAVYPETQAPHLLAAISKNPRRSTWGQRAYRTQYGHAIRIAVEAGLDWQVPFVAAVIAECLGPSRLDADVRPSGEAGIPGVPRSRRRLR